MRCEFFTLLLSEDMKKEKIKQEKVRSFLWHYQNTEIHCHFLKKSECLQKKGCDSPFFSLFFCVGVFYLTPN